MIESTFSLSQIKLALKRKDLSAKKYKLQTGNIDGVSQENLPFLNTINGTKVSGKVVRSANERDHWPLLNHENIAPVLDVLNIRNDLKIYMTMDIQVKLKDIIHREDFVYNSECFDRKKAYAKGIFSGLSYIHDKYLCLMNLSDDNICICNVHDKAVITNFSFISHSGKTTRNKLRVPEHYKAPETEKHEFDSSSAEIWAGGCLMLDMFFAHMVPWAVIDYKPRRVMEMVKKLSLDFLQAGNAGSVITATDFTEFKAFLKCFFKESHFRITAWLASIASFLSVKNRSKISPKRIFNPNCHCSLQQTENTDSIPAKNLSKSVISKTDTNLNKFFKNNDVEFEEYFNCNESNTQIYQCGTQNCLKSDSSGSRDSNCTDIDERFSTGGVSTSFSLQNLNEEIKGTKKTDINVRKNSTDITCDKQIRSDEKPFHCSEDKKESCSTSKLFLNKSCQMMTEKMNLTETNQLNFKYQQSKSLPFLRHNGVNCEIPDKISYSKFYFCSNVSLLSVRKSIESDLKKSDFCLRCLFENKEEKMTAKKVLPKAPNIANTRNVHNSFEDFIRNKSKNQEILPEHFVNEPETRLPSRYSSPNSNNKMSTQKIREKFAALKKAEVSLSHHKSLFTSKELADKQQNLFNQYRDLLRKEKMRLCEILSIEYNLSLNEVKKLSKSFGSKPRHAKKYNRRSISSKELQFSSSEFSEFQLEDTRKKSKIAHRRINHDWQKLKNPEDGFKLIPRKRLSYCKAIESSANEVCKSRDNKLGTREDNRKVKSAREPQVTKDPNCPTQNLNLQNPVLKVKLKDTTELLTSKKEKKNTKNDIKTPLNSNKSKTIRKPLCFSLCPGGKVEQSFDDLCEACRLGYGVY